MQEYASFNNRFYISCVKGALKRENEHFFLYIVFESRRSGSRNMFQHPVVVSIKTF
jgi:hypothetical protein